MWRTPSSDITREWMVNGVYWWVQSDCCTICVICGGRHGRTRHRNWIIHQQEHPLRHVWFFIQSISTYDLLLWESTSGKLADYSFWKGKVVCLAGYYIKQWGGNIRVLLNCDMCPSLFVNVTCIYTCIYTYIPIYTNTHNAETILLWTLVNGVA